jgi:DNA adenine methylase
MRPFLKWAGGKTRLLEILLKSLPQKPFGRYFEPFLGGGAMFFGLSPNQASLSDSNPELISCYQVVRDFPNELLAELKRYPVNETEFYRVRAIPPVTLGAVQRAARFIYLNKTCYNGVYRVNKSGEFNTPFGHCSPDINLVDERNLRRVSNLLKSATLVCQDYQSVIEGASQGDFIYFDPPYVPVSKFADFKRYTKEFFYETDHARLAEIFVTLDKRGCFVLLSNSFHDSVAAMYSRYFQTTVQAPRFVNCKGQGRGNVAELLISNYPILRID